MRKPTLVSIGLHVAVFLALIIGIPFLKPPMEIAQPIPIDVMDVGDITTTTHQGEGNQAKPKEIAPPPKAEPKEQKELPKPDVKPEPPKPAPKPEPVPEKTKPPEEDKTNATIPEKKKKPEKPKEDKPPEKVKEPVKEKPQDKPSEKKDDTKQDFDQLLKNLTPAKDDNKPAPDSTTSPDAKPNSSTGSKGIVSDKLTISQEDALRRQIEQCWNIPTGGRDVENMIVDVKIDVNPDRTVKNVILIDQARANSDPFFRSLAESAMRAVRQARCSPLELPPDQYETWKTITFRFNPKEMLGG